MSVDHVLAVVPVADFDAARAWYERVLGRPADNRPMEDLAEWQVTGSGWVQVFRDEERAGLGLLNLAVDDLDRHVADLAERGVEAGAIRAATEDVRLSTITDPDGNEVTFIGNFRVRY